MYVGQKRARRWDQSTPEVTPKKKSAWDSEVIHKSPIAAVDNTMYLCKSERISEMLCSVDQLSDFTLELCISCLLLNSVVFVLGRACSCLDKRELGGVTKAIFVDICIANRHVVRKRQNIIPTIIS